MYISISTYIFMYIHKSLVYVYAYFLANKQHTHKSHTTVYLKKIGYCCKRFVYVANIRSALVHGCSSKRQAFKKCISSYSTCTRVSSFLIDVNCTLLRTGPQCVDLYFRSSIFNPDLEWFASFWISDPNCGVSRTFQHVTSFVHRRVNLWIFSGGVTLVDFLKEGHQHLRAREAAGAMQRM